MCLVATPHNKSITCYGYLWLDDIGEDNSFCSMSGIKVKKIKYYFLLFITYLNPDSYFNFRSAKKFPPKQSGTYNEFFSHHFSLSQFFVVFHIYQFRRLAPALPESDTLISQRFDQLAQILIIPCLAADSFKS